MGTFAVDRASRPASHRRPAGSGDRIRRAEFTATQGARLAAGHRPRRHPMYRGKTVFRPTPRQQHGSQL